MRKFSVLLLLSSVFFAGCLPLEAKAGEGSPPQEQAARPVSERFVRSDHDAAGNPYFVVEVTWSDGSKTFEARPGFFT